MSDSNKIEFSWTDGRGTYNKTEMLGSSSQAVVYNLQQWNGAAPLAPGLVIKVLKSAQWSSPDFLGELRNLIACKRWKAGPGTVDGKHGVVMLHGVGTSTLQGSADWRAVKTKEELNRLHDVVAPQVAAMVVQWMNTYNRMHTDVGEGNIMVKGSGSSMEVTDLVDLGSMLEKVGKQVIGTPPVSNNGSKAFRTWTTDPKVLEADIRKYFLNKNRLLG